MQSLKWKIFIPRAGFLAFSGSEIFTGDYRQEPFTFRMSYGKDAPSRRAPKGQFEIRKQDQG